jgi:8-oxo-dGTP pyrophosphatase MutT (NUDIX family)
MIDCGFQKDNAWFRYRSGALIVNDDKMLFVKCKFADYYYIIGGGVHHGEISADCVEREVFEETGVNGKAENLCLLIENFFKGKDGAIDNLDCHTLEFYYRVKLDDVSKIKSSVLLIYFLLCGVATFILLYHPPPRICQGFGYINFYFFILI